MVIKTIQMVLKYALKIFACLMLFVAQTVAQEVLIVADEIPAMEVLAKAFKNQEGITCKIVMQSEMPASLSDFKAVIVYFYSNG